MKAKTAHASAMLIFVATLLPVSAQTAPRSTPVTVVNDASTPVPVDVTSGIDTHYVYVGRSTDSTAPSAGNIGMNQLCSATFTGSRMCTTAELILTGSPPTTSGNQWVAPSFTGAVIGTDIVDFTGITGTPLSMTCGTTGINGGPWTDPTTGTALLYVPTTGQIVFGTCAATRSVACCAPQ